MVPIEPWRNSTPFFGDLGFGTTKIDDLKTKCPCRCHIHRLHYPAFAAFSNTEMIKIYIILGLRLPDSKVLMRGHLATKTLGDISHYAQENNGDGNITIMLLKHKPNFNMMQFGLMLGIVVNTIHSK